MLDGISYDEMMDRAGKALAARIQKRLTNHSNQVVLFLIGPGNNGGDGLVAARELGSHADIIVFACLLRPRSDHLTKTAEDSGIHIFKLHIRVWAKQIVSNCYGCQYHSGFFIRYWPKTALTLMMRTSMLEAIKNALEDKHSQQNTLIDLYQPKHSNTLPFVIATDCPSGMDVNSGQLDMNTLPAGETVTYLCAKPGFFREAATHHVGKLDCSHLRCFREIL